MSLGLYMDEQVPSAIADGLRQRGVDVLTAQDDGRIETPDTEVLNRAGELGRVVFTMDDDFLAEATRPQRAGEAFVSVAYAHQLGVTIGRCVQDLELIAKASDLADHANSVKYLPL